MEADHGVVRGVDRRVGGRPPGGNGVNTKLKTFKVTIRFEVPVLRMYWDHQFVDPG